MNQRYMRLNSILVILSVGLFFFAVSTKIDNSRLREGIENYRLAEDEAEIEEISEEPEIVW